MFWACARCSILKEEGYAKAREAGIDNYYCVHEQVAKVMEENGVKPGPIPEVFRTLCKSDEPKS